VGKGHQSSAFPQPVAEKITKTFPESQVGGNNMASRMFERKRRDRYRPLNEKKAVPQKPVIVTEDRLKVRPIRETILPDDYPVYAGYAYVADGKVIVSDVSGTVKLLKNDTGATEIKSCDLVGRNLL
jgi:hypothetical protein